MGFFFGLIIGIIIGVVLAMYFVGWIEDSFDYEDDDENDYLTIEHDWWDDDEDDFFDDLEMDDLDDLELDEFELELERVEDEFSFITVSLVEDDTYPFPTPGTHSPIYYEEQDLEDWYKEQEELYSEEDEEMKVFGKIS